MADAHETDPGVEIIKKRYDRSAVPARYLIGMIDGTNRAKDIAQQLVEAGIYPTLNSASVTLSVMTKSINSLAAEQWGQPLIVKDTSQSPYSCNAELVDQFVSLRSALLPMDMGAVDPTLFMNDEEKEKYRYRYARFVTLAGLVEEISGSLTDAEMGNGMQIGAGESHIFLPKKSLGQIYTIAGGESAEAFTGILDAEQTKLLKLTGTKAQVLNEVSYTLAGRQLINVSRTGSMGKVRLQYEIDQDVLATLAKVGSERAKMPEIAFEPEDVPGLEANIQTANNFMNGKLRELGFVNTLSLRDSLVIREMLEQCDFTDPSLLARSKQVLTIINRRLVAWSVIRGKDHGYYILLKGIAVEGRPEDGACRGVDPEFFYPERGESTKESKDVCGRCKRCGDCLEFSIVNNEKFGIWGGKSERERRRLRKQRKAQDRLAQLGTVEVVESNGSVGDCEEDDLETA